MYDIFKVAGIYRARELETNTKKCHINFSERIPLLSKNSEMASAKNEWLYIIGEKKTKEKPLEGELIKKDLCLCGMEIDHAYYIINENTKNIAQIGSVCIDRINEAILKRYKKSLHKAGYCDICGVNVKDIERHNEQKTHLSKIQGFRNIRENVLGFLIINKIKKYKKSLLVPGICYLCGNIEDIRNHNEKCDYIHYNKLNSIRENLKRLLESFIKKHTTRVDLLKNNKKCVEFGCNNYISLEEPHWKTRCVKCYIKSKRTLGTNTL